MVEPRLGVLGHSGELEALLDYKTALDFHKVYLPVENHCHVISSPQHVQKITPNVFSGNH
ncbi:hypothetical protein PAXINDRAFT_12854 [Paxillus involutus ATCC 200175]|uniref:Uncharacterized protein n=1 Tax=Paxillus involutus ATCC 200175 TaxID=664439 RepID=A0A0C9TF44_PAXIN|nr:hypothetical protein PAXINDRAFT_12854 [Paxillus involutus ATCC 200175]